ncbi:phosphoglycerate dehydrogenase-like oxidoreductase [Rhizobium sp. CF122]|uniref:hydroxyacid dehydrogenase n=1 Tax=Rhizobium sp. CF122 TaxID=1144312 RepID=UPI000271B121|nr:hydroxyacid dehydrogenase [Rhizobium sp. CF122]EJL57883.1 phosphoglycerate dehydrogenase-like oxidoreductase [Rhizobium sp. CF122]
MPHILVAGKLHPSGVTLLKNAAGVTFDYVEEVSEQSYRPFIGKADALVLRTQPLSAPTVAEATSLKVVSRHGVGYDAVDLPSLNERGIALTIVGDVNSVSVAEHAMMLILSAAKRVLRGDRAVRSPAEWGWRNRLEAEEISRKRLLIIGFGRIGRHLSRMAAGFGMEIKAYDPYLQAQGWPEGHVSPSDDLLKGLRWADIISVNIPKADRPIIGEAELAALKPGSILVNTARGGVVDEKALVGALKSGRVGAAGLDVFDDEPPGASNELLEFDQVVLSPHIAGLTRECGERMAVASVQNVLDYFAGQIDPKLVVNAGELQRS